MEIQPYYNNEQLSPANVIVRINPDDRDRANALVARTAQILVVNNSDTLAYAKAAAGQLRAMLDEITNSRKAAQAPFMAVREAISNLAQTVGDPVETEHKRILGLLNGYVARVESEQKAEAQKHALAIRRQQEEHDRKIKEARDAQQRAEAEARAAKDEAQREKARAEANAKMLVAAQEELAKEIAQEIALIGADKPKAAIITGGRVDHVYDCRLVNVRATVKEGCWNLLRWELDKLACNDSIKAQLEINPDDEPTLPGIVITKRVNVSVKASARVA
jgi:hypothetical protein